MPVTRPLAVVDVLTCSPEFGRIFVGDSPELAGYLVDVQLQITNKLEGLFASKGRMVK